MSILVVEDDPCIRSILVRVLTQAGHTVAEAVDGREALERLRDGAELPSLILLDLMMPGMDGVTFRQEQLSDPRLVAIPVVVMSARGDLIPGFPALELVSHDLKPFDIVKMLELVTRAQLDDLIDR